MPNEKSKIYPLLFIALMNADFPEQMD